ncbi:MAG: ABC transporter ATP-binding protein [Archangiaceae bacterium]|nr:ABC transporter ATP-binding protein [Archangiaceae bacterium]
MIEVTNLTKRYRDRVAIDRLNFTVEKGEILGFLGPNGAGKSTTMKILTGFLPPTEGQAKIDGFDVFEQPLEVKKRIGYLPETPPLYPEMKVRGYLHFVGRLKALGGAKLKDEIDRVTKATGTHAELDRLIGTLSKGYQHRVGLAQAMLGSPPLMILDEPTEGLDPKQRAEVLELIRSLAGKQTIVLSTHILSEVEAIAQKVLIINSGKIVAYDSLKSIAGSGGLLARFAELTSA